MSDRLVLLGTKGGPAIRPGGPWPTSSLLELGGGVIIVDCGLGVTRGIVDAGLSLKALDLVFVTHLHSDHVLELGPLLHTAWTAGPATPVTVHGPAGTREYWQPFLQSIAFDIDIRIADEGRPDLRDLISISEFSEGQVLDEGALVVTALRVEHPPVTECYALRFEHCGRSVVFSAEADVGRLVVNHLIPADDPEIGEADWVAAVRKSWSGRLTIGRDGHVVPISGEAA